ncbi:MAG: hypothetical protein M3435_01690, partial [Actinomycetota bacterium]|nr:hypothetical protein [Actinomycetota bacterium]
LTAEAKGLVQAAAVLGKVFWLGAVAAVSGRERWNVEQELHDLERRELLRRERRGSVEGETEYAFRHLLVRDVAYGQIPRGERAGKHQAAAAWIESLGRPEDHAEMLAHHYVNALELSRAAGLEDADLSESARAALRIAGDRALALNTWAAAADLFTHAVSLWPEDDRDRPELLLSYGSALQQIGDGRAGDVLSEAREGLVELDELERAARADAALSRFWWDRGQRDRSFGFRDRALALVVERSPSPDKLFVLNQTASSFAIAGEADAAIRIGEEALVMAEQLGLDEHRVLALSSLGIARSRTDDPRGSSDLERALELAVSINSPEAGRLYNNLGFDALGRGDVRRDVELRAEALRTARRFGDERMVRFCRGARVSLEYLSGRWEDCMRHADEFLAECEAGSPHYLESDVRQWRASLRFARGDTTGAESDAAKALELVRQVKDPQLFHHVFSSNIRLNAELGRLDVARARSPTSSSRPSGLARGSTC